MHFNIFQHLLGFLHRDLSLFFNLFSFLYIVCPICCFCTQTPMRFTLQMANKLTPSSSEQIKIIQLAVVKMVGKPAEEPTSLVSPVSQRQPDLTATLPALPVCLICHTPTAAAATAADTNKGSELLYELKHDFLVHLLFQNEPGPCITE